MYYVHKCDWFAENVHFVPGFIYCANRRYVVVLFSRLRRNNSISNVTWDITVITNPTKHYSDVIMGATASQITGISIVCLTVCSGADKKTSKLRVTGLCEGNRPVTGGFPSQKPITRKMFTIDRLPCFPEYNGHVTLQGSFTGYFQSAITPPRDGCQGVSSLVVAWFPLQGSEIYMC